MADDSLSADFVAEASTGFFGFRAIILDSGNWNGAL